MWIFRTLNTERPFTHFETHNCMTFTFCPAHYWWLLATIAKHWISWTKNSMGKFWERNKAYIVWIYLNCADCSLLLQQSHQSNTSFDEKLLKLRFYRYFKWRNHRRFIDNTNSNQLASRLPWFELLELVFWLIPYVAIAIVQFGFIHISTSKFSNEIRYFFYSKQSIVCKSISRSLPCVDHCSVTRSGPSFLAHWLLT